MTAVLAACEPDYKPPVRVGLIVFPGHEPLFLARSLGYFKGRPIQLVELPSTVEVVRAYRAGVIDVAGLTADEAMSVAEDNPSNHRIILIVDISNGADVIVARPEFNTIADLRGRRIGFEPNAAGAMMLARALELAGLTPTDVTPVPVALADHEQAYIDGAVDAVVTFEPNSSRLLARGAHKIFDTSHIPDEIVNVLITRTDVIEERDRALRSLLEGWFKALRYLQEHPQDAAARVAARERVTPEQFLESLRGVKLPDVQTNRRMLGDSEANLGPQLRRVIEVMTRANLLTRPMDPESMLEDELLPAT